MKLLILNAIRAAAWLLAVVIVVLSVVPPGLRPETDMPHGIEHFSIFFVNGAAFGLGYGPRRGLVTIGLVIFSAAVEIAQLFVPGRHARLSDFVVDAVAACAGVAMTALVARRVAVDLI